MVSVKVRFSDDMWVGGGGLRDPKMEQKANPKGPCSCIVIQRVHVATGFRVKGSLGFRVEGAWYIFEPQSSYMVPSLGHTYIPYIPY